jgi:CRISPR-associated protein Cmr6
MDRYLRVTVKDDGHKKAREELLMAICQAVTRAGDSYKAAYERNKSAIPEPAKKGLFRTTGRTVIGLGGENVLETGLTLHRTYGTPLIPGTALKGLASHYCDLVWGAKDPDFKRGGPHHCTLFGTTEDSGHMIFHDAWMTSESLAGSLQPDIMTPHHGDYYSGTGAPTDFDDPKPVTFLSIAGTFDVAVSCDVPGKDGKAWADLAFKILCEALREWGIGGKTSAGYGRLGLPADKSKTKTTPGDPDETEGTTHGQPRPTVAESKVKRPNHKKGEVVEVTREADPNVKRGKAYFRADDGFGGFVQIGRAPSREIGQKTLLEVSGVMNDGYVFAIAGSKKANIKNKGKGGKK